MTNELSKLNEEQTSALSVAIARAEIDQQISTARAYPRIYSVVKEKIDFMASINKKAAEECRYALPRKQNGKTVFIYGASIRFAEILKQAFGNCRCGARLVEINKEAGYVEAEGVFHDLETNTSTTMRVQRRIKDRDGRLYNDDMIMMTGNAACSIAVRNAIIRGIPKPLWYDAYAAIEEIIEGNALSMKEQIDKVISAFNGLKISQEAVFKILSVSSRDDIKRADIGILRGIYTAIKNGEAELADYMPDEPALTPPPAAPKADIAPKDEKQIEPKTPPKAPETKQTEPEKKNINDGLIMYAEEVLEILSSTESIEEQTKEITRLSSDIYAQTKDKKEKNFIATVENYANLALRGEINIIDAEKVIRAKMEI